MASTKLWGVAQESSGDVLVYALQGPKRGLVRISDSGAPELVRTFSATGAERFDYFEPCGVPTVVLAHPFDALLYRFPLSGRGNKIQAARSFGDNGVGMINALCALGEELFVLRSCGCVEVFDGQKLERWEEGLPPRPDTRSDWGADHIVRAWGGAPCIGTGHGIYLLQGTMWVLVAPGRLVRALAYLPEREELCVLGKSVAFIKRDGSEERFAAGDEDFWQAAVHEGEVYAFSPRPGHGVFHMPRDGKVRALDLNEPAPKNQALQSTANGLVFCGYEGTVYRMKSRSSGWQCLWESAKNPVAF